MKSVVCGLAVSTSASVRGQIATVKTWSRDGHGAICMQMPSPDALRDSDALVPHAIRTESAPADAPVLPVVPLMNCNLPLMKQIVVALGVDWCHHRVPVLANTKAMPLLCSFMRFIHCAVYLPYGGLHHTSPCHGWSRPLSSLVNRVLAGTWSLPRPALHTSMSKVSPMAWKMCGGVYHSICSECLGSCVNPWFEMLMVWSACWR